MSESTTAAERQQGTDQRLAKGARSRASIARHAAEVASVEGLTGVSIGRLATDLGLSKSGIATLFGNKESLQLAAVKAARDVFLDRVVTPSLDETSGITRLRALVERWFAQVAEPAFPGGCFRVATLAEFDSRPGPVRDAISADRRDFLTFLSNEIRVAQEQGHLGERNADAVAFELDAVIAAAHNAQQMGDEWGWRRLAPSSMICSVEVCREPAGRRLPGLSRHSRAAAPIFGRNRLESVRVDRHSGRHRQGIRNRRVISIPDDLGEGRVWTDDAGVDDIRRGRDETVGE